MKHMFSFRLVIICKHATLSGGRRIPSSSSAAAVSRQQTFEGYPELPVHGVVEDKVTGAVHHDEQVKQVEELLGRSVFVERHDERDDSLWRQGDKGGAHHRH